jgi:hypothetical protein
MPRVAPPAPPNTSKSCRTDQGPNRDAAAAAGSGTTCSGGPQLHLANQLHLSSSTWRVAVLVVQYGVMMSPDHSVTISAFRVAYLVLLHLGHHMLQQRAQPERAHRACAEWRA